MKETLYILSSEYELTKDHDTINCTQPDPDREGKVTHQSIPVSRLEAIEVYGQLKFSTPVLEMCNDLGIPCYFNSFYGNPYGQFLPSKAVPAPVRLQQYAAFADPVKKLHIAQAIVRKAITERIRVLTKFARTTDIASWTGRLLEFQEKAGDTQSVNELRGIEGNYMKTFFDAFARLLMHLPFDGRSQQPPKDEGNAVLSFGNVLLYNTVNAEVYRSGLDTLVGFLHEAHENRNSLSIDIAEIFRPIIVDNLILRLDHKNILNPSCFDKDAIKCYLNTRGKTTWIETYKEFCKSSIRYTPLNRSISIKEEIKLECYNLIKYLTGETDRYHPLAFPNE